MSLSLVKFLDVSAKRSLMYLGKTVVSWEIGCRCRERSMGIVQGMRGGKGLHCTIAGRDKGECVMDVGQGVDRQVLRLKIPRIGSPMPD